MVLDKVGQPGLGHEHILERLLLYEGEFFCLDQGTPQGLW